MPMLMPASPRASNMVAATPEWERMPMPTAESLAMPASVSIFEFGADVRQHRLERGLGLAEVAGCMVNECRAKPSCAMF